MPEGSAGQPAGADEQPQVFQPYDIGASVPDGSQPYQQVDYSQQPYGQAPAYGQPQPAYGTPVQAVDDKGSIGWGVLGFLFPIVGLVLFLVWKSNKPKSAKVAGIGALIGFCLNLVFMLAGGLG